LEVRTGEVFGFLGPNGAGKTTTMRLLLDLIRPDRGTVSVLGLDPRADGVVLSLNPPIRSRAAWRWAFGPVEESW
jgi:ABC-type multidrug transport system ATPase subunit